MNDRLIEALAVTYAAAGQEVGDTTIRIVASDLSAYPLNDVLAALARCRSECRKIALADILDRLPNGHQGPEQAWASVRHAIGDERVTLVLSEPTRAAFLAADALAGDEIAARMAFREVYMRETGEARAEGGPVRWTFILGSDAAQRDDVITQAVVHGKLAPDRAFGLLAHRGEPVDFEQFRLLAPEKTGLISPGARTATGRG